MRKSLHTKAYAVFTGLLRDARMEAGVTQVQLGERLGIPQYDISKIETGDRRLDAVQLHEWCEALGIDVVAFTAKLKEALAPSPKVRKRR